MRVITGTARGRVLKTLEGDDVRPTTDRVKEAIFSIIQFEIEGRRVLDLFAGSGQLGIEALSRGAAFATFTDMSAESVDTVKKNLISTKLDRQSEVIRTEAVAFLRSNRKKFDIIFMDPPYYKNMFIDALSSIDEADLLCDDGIIVVEHDTKDKFVDKIGRLEKTRDKKYGNTTLTFYKLEE